MLPSAVGVAISPLPIVAVVLMLVTARGRVNGPAFLLGWWVGIAVVGTIVLAVATIAGATAIAQTGIPGGEQAVALVVFILIASLGVAAPIVIYFALGDRAGPLLERLKNWLAENNAVIMAVLVVIIGVKLIGDAISGFSSSALDDQGELVDPDHLHRLAALGAFRAAGAPDLGLAGETHLPQRLAGRDHRGRASHEGLGAHLHLPVADEPPDRVHLSEPEKDADKQRDESPG
jgi:hypothetical protein